MTYKYSALCLGAFVSFCVGSNLLAQQTLCDLANTPGIGGPNTITAKEVLAELGRSVPFDYNRIEVHPSTSQLVKDKGGAAAVMCETARTVRYIFYDPEYIATIRKNSGGSDLPRYFVFAHEVAHHVNGDTLRGGIWTPEQELAADESAAAWLTRMNVKGPDLVAAFNSLGFPEISTNGYPSRCERLTRVSAIYNTFRLGNTTGLAIPVCDSCASKPPTAGLYVTKALPALAALEPSNVLRCGTAKPTIDLPLEYDNDIAGMCTVQAIAADTQLTWQNIDVCSLLR